MPAKNNTGTGTGTKKEFNPSLGPLSPAKSGSGNYVGIPINADTFATLQSKITIGMTPLLKKSPKLNKNGQEYFFLEFLPQQENTARNTSTNDEV